MNSLTTDAVLAPDVSLSSLATQTAALVASDLVDLVARAKFTSMERLIRITYVILLINALVHLIHCLVR